MYTLFSGTNRAKTQVVLVAAALGLVTTLLAARAEAGPVGFQGYGGWYTESEEFFLGAGARFGLSTFTVIPNAEWLFVDNGSAYSLNVDGTMNVVPLGVATGYAGAGVGWLITDPDGGESNTETVINLLAGASFNLTSFNPFAQFKWVVADGDDPLVFALGLRF
jgi:hypothetical protein